MAAYSASVTDTSDKFQAQAVEIAAKDTSDAVDRLNKDLVALIDVNKNQMLKIMRKEIATTVDKSIAEALKVPDLIGEKCQYSTYANFMTHFHSVT